MMTKESAFHVKRSTQWNIFGDFATEAIERERYGFGEKKLISRVQNLCDK